MKLLQQAKTALWEMVGTDKIMTLATVMGDGVSARTVNIFTYEEAFYFITENHSNKYNQLKINPKAALSIDAIQIFAEAELLSHPFAKKNKELVDFIEKQLPSRLEGFRNREEVRFIKLVPVQSVFLSMESFEGYFIDFKEGFAKPLKHE